MPIITLTTDFGLRDPFVGVMKGVILGRCPEVRIVDLTHEIPSQSILDAALALDAAVDYFPPGTIHLAVVDPGVGTDRAALIVRTQRSDFLVGPDNGLFTLVLERHPAVSIHRIVPSAAFTHPLAHSGDPSRPKPRLGIPPPHPLTVSATFHGRDLFAPASAALACGAESDSLGEPLMTQIMRLDFPHPVERGEELKIHILAADCFGNLMTNLTLDRCRAWRGERSDRDIRLSLGAHEIVGISRTYADVALGHPLACFNSMNRLEIAVRNGSAAERFGLRRFDSVRLQGALSPRSK